MTVSPQNGPKGSLLPDFHGFVQRKFMHPIGYRM